MNREQLERSALSLTQPSAAASAEYLAHKEPLAAELNQHMLGRTDLAGLIGGDTNREMMQNNSHNMVRFMGTMLLAYDPAVLVQTVAWVFRSYMHHGFTSLYWAANLDTFLAVAREQLSAQTYQEVAPFFEWLIVHTPRFAELPQDDSSPGSHE